MGKDISQHTGKDQEIVIRALTDREFSVSDEFLLWLEADEGNKRLYQQLMLCQQDILEKSQPAPDVAEAWETFKQDKIAKDETEKNQIFGSGKVKAMVKFFMATAAALIIAFLVLSPKASETKGDSPLAESHDKPSVVEEFVAKVMEHTPFAQEKIDSTNIQEYIADYQRQMDEGEISVEVEKVMVEAGATDHYVLEDGTEIWMNVGSQVTYPKHFGDGARIVELRGEAYFKVKHDEKRPFVVVTPYFNAIDLGTGFNIKAYNKEHASITLCEGKVAVSLSEQQPLTNLSPGEKAELTSHGLDISHADTDMATAWMHGYFSYDGATVGEVLDDLARYYGKEIVAEDKTVLDTKVKFWASKRDSFHDVMRYLLYTSGIDMYMTDSSEKVYIVRHKDK